MTEDSMISELHGSRRGTGEEMEGSVFLKSQVGPGEGERGRQIITTHQLLHVWSVRNHVLSGETLTKCNRICDNDNTTVLPSSVLNMSKSGEEQIRWR